MGEEIYTYRGDWEMREVYIPAYVNTLKSGWNGKLTKTATFKKN